VSAGAFVGDSLEEPPPPPQAAIKAAMPTSAVALRNAVADSSIMIRLLSSLAIRVGGRFQQ
jgi:hypothetical protein